MQLLTQETIAVRKAAYAKACISSYTVGMEKKGSTGEEYLTAAQTFPVSI